MLLFSILLWKTAGFALSRSPSQELSSELYSEDDRTKEAMTCKFLKTPEFDSPVR